MNKQVVDALIKLYALLAVANKTANFTVARSFVESYLKKDFSDNSVNQWLIQFDHFYQKLTPGTSSINYEQEIKNFGKNVNKQLHQKQKIRVLIYLLQFVKHWQYGANDNVSAHDSLIQRVRQVSDALLIHTDDFNDLFNYIFNTISKIEHKEKVLLVHNNPYLKIRGIQTKNHQGLNGQLLFFYLSSNHTFLFKYSGNDMLTLQGKQIFANHIYVFEKGVSIRGAHIHALYYSNVITSYLSSKVDDKVQLQVQELEFRFPKSKNGIHAFSFLGESGKMLGIMGGSGTGKSTLINLLNGSLKPKSGTIAINGYEIHKNYQQIKGLIGYIPQDDLLIEELTVYQNLWYSAQLCFGNLSKTEIRNKVDKTLLELDLFEIKDLKVGNVLNKFISGGQRKRLNIALELIREPVILFVDEPTSGLSSADSDRVVALLKEQSLSGKFMAINIHQPSSDILKQFDDILVLDKGGYPVYYGNPIDAISYFKTMAGMVDADESMCSRCGNLNTDEILQTIELNQIDEYGAFTDKRKVTPEQWYAHFNEKLNPKVTPKKIDLPQSKFKPPGFFKQFVVFSLRNLFSKLADKQYMIISLLVTPVLAFLLSVLTKYMAGDANNPRKYIFFDNENIPAFIFMAIIVALFVGLIVSAEEIFRDKRILKREAFLNLSRLSYFNSKIIFLFILSALQTLTFVLIGNAVLEIKGMTLSFWLVLFSTSCFANLVGLNISSAFKSAVTIYIIIPLVLVPQILLSGVIVKFDKLNNALSAQENVPVIGDMMASRWAYEAMMVNQFKDNEYQKLFFDIDQQISAASFTMNYKLPRLIQKISDANKNFSNPDYSQIKKTDLKITYHELQKVEKMYGVDLISEKMADFINSDKQRLKQLYNDLYILKSRLSKFVAKLLRQKDKQIQQLSKQHGDNYIFNLKQKYANQRVNEFVLNNRELKRVKQINDHFIQLYEPVYLYPTSKTGRAQFYAPVKQIGSLQIDTLWFNIGAIWLMTLVLYIALWRNALEKIINFLENRKFRKLNG